MDPAVFGYIRVSQAEGESGLATQRRILNDYGLRDDRIFTDVASGKNMRRPSWRTLLETLKPGDTVVVPRIDRLARNLTEGLRTIEELHAQGINIRTLAEGLDTGDDSPTPGSCSICCSPWRSGRGTPSGTVSGPAWTAPRPRGGPGAGLRHCRPRRWRRSRGFLENGGSVSAAALPGHSGSVAPPSGPLGMGPMRCNTT